jgi:hypothetical protein
VKCEKYQKITLLNVAYKILSNIILQWLKEYSEEIMGDYQCGFRPQRGATDQIFVVRQIHEKFYEHCTDIYLLFFDFKNVFTVLTKIKATGITSEFWDTEKDRKTRVSDTRRRPSESNSRGEISSPFSINKGVRQGDVLSATQFNLTFHKALKNLGKNKTILNGLTQICGYADDILVIARNLPALEVLCIELSREAGRVGLVVSPDKTKYMRFSASPSRRTMKGATINCVTCEGVAEFIYLGMLICNDNSV